SLLNILNSSLATFRFAGLLGGLLGGGLGARSRPGLLARTTIDNVLELLSGAEGGDAAGRNAQRSKGSRVTAGSGLTGAALEGSETNESHFFALGQRGSDRMNDRAQGAA